MKVLISVLAMLVIAGCCGGCSEDKTEEPKVDTSDVVQMILSENPEEFSKKSKIQEVYEKNKTKVVIGISSQKVIDNNKIFQLRESVKTNGNIQKSFNGIQTTYILTKLNVCNNTDSTKK